MRPHIILGLLLAIVSLPAEDAATLTFDDAKRLEQDGKLRPAIDAYRTIIERDRRDLGQAAPALIRLVDCYRQLKNDEAAATDFARDAGKFLSRPVNLTDDLPFGETALLSLEHAKEDLLWKSWDPGQQPHGWSRFAFLLQSADESRRIQKGVRTSILTLSLQGKSEPGVIELEASRVSACEAIGEDDERYPAASASANASESSGQSQVTIWARFQGLPPGLKRIKKLSGTIAMTQVVAYTSKDLAIKEGASCEFNDSTLTIRQFRQEADVITMTVELRRHGERATGSQIRGEAHQLTVTDAEGQKIQSVQSMSTNDGEKCHYGLHFPRSSKPARLTCRMPNEMSSHDVTFTIADIELP